MFGIADQFYSMTALYDLYLKVASTSNRTLLLRSHVEYAQWKAWEQRAKMHAQKKDYPLSHWAYLALVKCGVHELKGELDAAFDWYDQLWQRLIDGQDVVQLGDKRFLSSFQSYILLALKTGNATKAQKANELFRVVISEHHDYEMQHIDIMAITNGVASIEKALSEYVAGMSKAKKNEAYYHRGWSPHIRYEMYLGLFRLCFNLKDHTSCMALLKWGNDRLHKTETASDLSQIIPLLSTIVMFERCKRKGKMNFSKIASITAHHPKSVYDKFRRKRELFPIETHIGMFLYKLSNTDSDGLPKLKIATLRTLDKLKKDAFYYPNLMQYFNFEKWIADLE